MYFNYFALRDNSVLLTFFAEKTPRSRKVKNTQKCINSIHCTANVHRGFTGFPSFFPAISMKEGCKNHRETLLKEKDCVVCCGDPCNIYRFAVWNAVYVETIIT